MLVRNHPLLLLVPNLLQTLLQSNSRDVKLRQKFAIASSVRQEPRGESSGSKSLADTVGPFDDVHAGSKKAIRRALVADLISLLSFRRHLCVTKSSLRLCCVLSLFSSCEASTKVSEMLTGVTGRQSPARSTLQKYYFFGQHAARRRGAGWYEYNHFTIGVVIYQRSLGVVAVALAG